MTNFLFLLCLISIFFYSVHYINLLLFLELLLLSIFLFMVFFLKSSYGLQGLFLFLLVVVCLGGFSVSLLVSLSRLSGRDFWYFRHIF